MRLLIITLILLPIFSHAEIKFFDVKNQKYISYKEMANKVPTKSFLVFSDTHYDLTVQEAQAHLMVSLIHSKKSYSNFEFFWEFLNYQDNKKINKLTVDYIDNQINSKDYVAHLFHQREPLVINNTRESLVNGGFNERLFNSSFIRKIIQKTSLDTLDTVDSTLTLELLSFANTVKNKSGNKRLLISEEHKNLPMVSDKWYDLLNKNHNGLTDNKSSIANSRNEVLKNSKLSIGNDAYIPLLEVVRDYNGLVIGINARRSTKQKIIKTGMKSVNKNLIPPNHFIGGKLYLERFSKAIEEHVPSDKVINYFEAQCYTDSVMSYQSVTNSSRDLSFIVAGSFHTDYFDGTVVRLKKASNKPVINFRFLNINEMTHTEILKILTPSAKFGAISDYILLVN